MDRAWQAGYVDLRTRHLSDEDAERLYSAHPRLARSHLDGCPTCGGVGTYNWKGEQTCDCEMQLQLHKHYLLANIGVLYQRLDWEDYDSTDNASVVSGTAEYLEAHQSMLRNGIGIIYQGPFGTGKSMLASLVAKESVKLGHVTFFTTFQGMVQMFTSGWTSTEDRRWFERRVVESDVLVLDDIGKEFRTKNNLAESLFDHVMRQRVFSGRVTIITTNDDEEELTKGYGAAVLSLLNERSMFMSLRGTDYRLTAKKRAVREALHGEQRPVF